MNYIKYFLFGLIAIWLIGFLYVFVGDGSHGKDRASDAAKSEARHNPRINSDEDTEPSEKPADSIGDLLPKVRKLESELKKLEEKNTLNEILIKELE